MKQKQRSSLRPVFVDSVPDAKLMKADALYVSMAYATAIHMCACGCGNETVTPLAPDEWRLIYDGETISLAPSIGNQRLECGSHYWIRRNRIVWVPDAKHRWIASLKKAMRKAIRRLLRSRTRSRHRSDRGGCVRLRRGLGI